MPILRILTDNEKGKMKKINSCSQGQYVISILNKGKVKAWQHFSFESVDSLKDAVHLVAAALNQKLPDTTDASIDLGDLVRIESSISDVHAIALPF